MPLGRVHRAVGARDQLVGRELGVVAQHDADRGLRVQQRTVARIRLAHRIDDARRDRARAAFGGDAVEQRDKLVAAHSRQRIAGPQDRAHAVRGLDQVVVAGAVAERIVDLLEAVEVEQEQHERPLLARGAELRQRGRERGTVRQAGQVVGLRGARELVAQLVARLDVACHRDRLGDAAVQAVGMAQRHLEADVAAVLVAPVAFEQHRPARAGSVLQRVDPVVGLARMQQLENSDSLHFVRRIAEVRQNRRRHVLDEPLGVDLHHDVFGVQLHEAVALDALGQRHLAPLHLEEDLVVAVDHRLQHDGQALADAVGQGQAEFGEVAERRLERTLFTVAPLQFAVGHDRGGGRQRDRRQQKAGRDHSQREVDDAAGDRDDGEREQLAHREPWSRAHLAGPRPDIATLSAISAAARLHPSAGVDLLRHVARRGSAPRNKSRLDRPRQSPSTQSIRAPSEPRFSTKRGWARRIGVALRITERPGMLAASISSAIATRMM